MPCPTGSPQTPSAAEPPRLWPRLLPRQLPRLLPRQLPRLRPAAGLPRSRSCRAVTLSGVLALSGLVAACEPASHEPRDPPSHPSAGQSRLDTAVDPAALAPADVREQGRRLLAQYQCGRCHRIPGVEGAVSDYAVPLDRFGRRSYIAGRIPNTPDRLVAWLRDPQSLVAGTAMPDLGVDDADARSMAAWLGGLR